MERKSLKELLGLLKTHKQSMDNPGTVYQHVKTGNYYGYLGCSFDVRDMTVVVRYAPIAEPGVEFSRPYADFRTKFRQMKL